MLRIYFSLLLVFLPLFVPAKDCLFCKGNTLVYEINNMGRNSLLLVKLKKVSAKKVVFDWMLTGATPRFGSTQMDAEVLASAMKTDMSFAKSEEISLEGMTSVWISRKAYSMLHRGDVTAIQFGNETQNFRKEGPYISKVCFHPDYGNLPALAALRASDEGGKTITVYQREDTAVILGLNLLGWEMNLVAVF